MQKKQSNLENKSIKKVILFCVVVVLLIFISLIIRFFVLIQKSKFDTKTRFTIAVQQPKKYTVLSFDPPTKSIVSVVIQGDAQNRSAQQILGVPVDGTMSLKESDPLSDDPAGVLTALLTKIKNAKKDITEIDLTQLLVFAHSIPPKDTEKLTVKIDTQPEDIDEQTASLFIDSQIIDDNKTIEIVNGTNVPGLGKRLERLLKNIGSNVIAVSSTQLEEPKSSITYYGEDSYTRKKISNTLHYPTRETQQRSIADIKIIIGEDWKEGRAF